MLRISLSEDLCSVPIVYYRWKLRARCVTHSNVGYRHCVPGMPHLIRAWLLPRSSRKFKYIIQEGFTSIREAASKQKHVLKFCWPSLAIPGKRYEPLYVVINTSLLQRRWTKSIQKPAYSFGGRDTAQVDVLSFTETSATAAKCGPLDHYHSRVFISVCFLPFCARGKWSVAYAVSRHTPYWVIASLTQWKISYSTVACPNMCRGSASVHDV